MSGSVGEIKIPIVSTFDPKGATAAKAAMRDLDAAGRSSGGGGGGGGGPPPASSAGADRARDIEQEQSAWRAAMKREGSFLASSQQYGGGQTVATKNRSRLADLSGFGQSARVELSRQAAATAVEHEKARKTASGGIAADAANGAVTQIGLGNPAAMLSKFATPMAATATAAVGLFVALQKSAMQAREIRVESQKLGIAVGMYHDLAWNASMAGVSMEDVSAGMEKLNAKATDAMTGGIASQAYFAGLGIGPEKLAAMQGDTAALAKAVAQRGNSAQQIQIFGSSNAANAIAESADDNGHGRAKNDALENTVILRDPWNATKQAYNATVNTLAYYTQLAGRALGGGKSFGRAGKEMDQEAHVDEDKERKDRIAAARQEAGRNAAVNLLNPREALAAEAKSEATYDYSDATALTGVGSEAFHARAATQRMAKQQAFDAQYQTPYEKMKSQGNLIDRQIEEGTLTPTQGYRANWANYNQTAAAVSGTRSNAENLRNAMTSFVGKWNDPEEQNPNGERSPLQRDAARDFGDKLTDFVQGMTSAGPQTAALGVNTVAGASQMMGVEYTMDQSQETRRMVELLLRIAENTEKVTKEQREAVTANLGYRQNDPISQLLGN